MQCTKAKKRPAWNAINVWITLDSDYHREKCIYWWPFKFRSQAEYMSPLTFCSYLYHSNFNQDTGQYVSENIFFSHYYQIKRMQILHDGSANFNTKYLIKFLENINLCKGLSSMASVNKRSTAVLPSLLRLGQVIKIQNKFHLQPCHFHCFL